MYINSVLPAWVYTYTSQPTTFFEIRDLVFFATLTTVTAMSEYDADLLVQLVEATCIRPCDYSPNPFQVLTVVPNVSKLEIAFSFETDRT